MYLCNNPACQNTISFFFLFFFLARLSNYPLNPLVLAEIAVSVAYYMMFMFYVYCRYLLSKRCGIQKHHIIDKIYKYLKYSLVPPPGVQSVSKTWRNFLLYCLVNFFFFTTRATTALVVFVSVLIMLVWNVTVTSPPGPPPRSFPLATGHSPAVAQMNKFNKVVCFPVLRPLIYLFIYSVVCLFRSLVRNSFKDTRETANWLVRCAVEELANDITL